jgi:hypothetical protein
LFHTRPFLADNQSLVIFYYLNLCWWWLLIKPHQQNFSFLTLNFGQIHQWIINSLFSPFESISFSLVMKLPPTSGIALRKIQPCPTLGSVWRYLRNSAGRWSHHVNIGKRSLL